MGEHAPLDGLIRDLYGSLSEQVDFEQPMRRLATAFRSHLSALSSEDLINSRSRLTLIGELGADDFTHITNVYNSRWREQNLWMMRSRADLLNQGFQHGDARVSERELLASPFYQHVLDPMDIRYGLAINMGQVNQQNLELACFHRNKSDAGFDADDLALAQQLRPHLINAYALYRRLHQVNLQALGVRASFDRAPVGMLVLDANGCILECNAVAERLLGTPSPLAQVRQGARRTIVFSDPGVAHQFNLAITRLINHPAPQPEVLALGPSASGHRSNVALHLCAYPQAMSHPMGRNARILGFLCELSCEQSSVTRNAVLQTGLGLTATEARVVLALHQHCDGELAARALGVAPSTVRTHLKNTFRKLRITRQGELLLRVERLLAGMPVDNP